VAMDVRTVFTLSLYNIGVLFNACAMAVMYAESQITLDPTFRLMRWRHLLVAAYPLLSVVYLVVSQLRFARLYAERYPLDFYYHSPGGIILSNFLYLPSLVFFVEMLFILHKAIVLRENTKDQKQISYVDTVIKGSIINAGQSLLWIIDRAFSLGFLWHLYVVSGSFIIIDFMLVAKDLSFFMGFPHPDKKKEYVKPRLERADTQDIGSKVTRAMELGKLYRKEDIKLADLASETGLTAHELSEYLNTQVQKNFTSFINYYRIEEAKTLLKDPDKLVVEIVYQVGFNTRASFNRVFKEELGLTPTEYRKLNSTGERPVSNP